MRDMSRRLNKDECIENVWQVLGLEELEELPHFDTINNLLLTNGNMINVKRKG